MCGFFSLNFIQKRFEFAKCHAGQCLMHHFMSYTDWLVCLFFKKTAIFTQKSNAAGALWCSVVDQRFHHISVTLSTFVSAKRHTV